MAYIHRKQITVSVDELCLLATNERRSARERGSRILVGFDRVQEEAMWDWFLQRITTLKGTIIRQTEGIQ